MKTLILPAILAISVSANAQTLKETLYSGKLKTDTGTVIRKGDDLSSKIDTSTRKPVVPEKIKTMPAAGDSSMSGGVNTSMNPSTIIADDSVATAAVPAKDNNKIWKEYIDTLTGMLRTEVLPSKKIKSGTYFVLIEYQIELDGQITVNAVSCSPESSFLEQQIKDRLTLTPPQMNPLVSTNGQPRKPLRKKQTLNLTK